MSKPCCRQQVAVGEEILFCEFILGHSGPHSWEAPEERRKEAVDHPAHYGGDTTYEAIKVIEAWGVGFHLGSALKYICRNEKSGRQLEDLKKARWYLNRYIEQLEKKT